MITNIFRGFTTGSGLRKGALGAVAAISAIFMATAANAVPLRTALSIVIDGSGSISSTDFTTQKNAYAAVLGDNSILKADGSVALNVIQFSNTAQVEQTAIRINSETDRNTVISAINAMSQIGNTTAIGDGINLGRSNLDALLGGIGDFATDFEKIIDVSTDGGNNTGADPTVATDQAIAGGYSAVNCLAVGAGNCSFMTGDGTVFSATDFNDLQRVLRLKIGTELRTIPVPATAVLFGFGLLGLGALRRRQAA